MRFFAALRMTVTFFFFLAVFPCLTAIPALAKPSLSQLQEQLAEQKKNEARIQSQMKEADRALAQTKKDMVNTAQSVRDNEQTLQTLETKITALLKDEAAVNQQIAGDYGSMGDLVLALSRMRRVPPEL